MKKHLLPGLCLLLSHALSVSASPSPSIFAGNYKGAGMMANASGQTRMLLLKVVVKRNGTIAGDAKIAHNLVEPSPSLSTATVHGKISKVRMLQERYLYSTRHTRIGLSDGTTSIHARATRRGPTPYIASKVVWKDFSGSLLLIPE